MRVSLKVAMHLYGIGILLLASILFQQSAWSYSDAFGFNAWGAKFGAVYTRGIINGANGRPLLVAYQEDGTESGELVREINPEETIYSGVEYRAAVAHYELLLSTHPNLELISKDQYHSIQFVTVDNKPIIKSPLASDTYLVAVAGVNERFTTKPESLKLAEYAIDVRFPLGEEVQSLLLNKFTKQIIYTSENNIGYRVRLYGDPDDVLGENAETGLDYVVNFNQARKATDRVFGPIPGLRISTAYDHTTMTESYSAGYIDEAGNYVSRKDHESGRPGVTDEGGRYYLRYRLPPCPGRSSGYDTHAYLELSYNRFNPRLPRYGFLPLWKPGYDTCVGLASGVPAIALPTVLGILNAMAEPVKRAADFILDIVFLNGHVSMNDGVSLVEIGDSTQYKVKSHAHQRVNQTNYDFDGDGVNDTSIIGRTVDEINPETNAPETQFYPQNHAQNGCSLDPQETAIPLCNQQGIYLSSSGIDLSQPPDIIRLADWQPDFQDQALVEQIGLEDLKNTDLYLIRESNGELLAERRGVPEHEVHRRTENETGVDESINRFFYTLEMRGPQGIRSRHRSWATPEGEMLTWDERFAYWQAQGGMDKKFYKHQADHIRPGERIKIVAINRATGYIGTMMTTIQQITAASDQMVNTIIVDEIKMRPPNLKIWAERLHDIDQGLSKEKGLKQNIGFEGAGLASDTAVTVYSEWLDHDGSALPAALNQYGYSGRLAKITGPNQLAGVNSQLSQFSIRPGRHTEVIHLSQEGVEKEHLYVQVSATPIERHPDFSNQGIHQGVIQYRPDQFVPFKVPVFDEDSTLLAQKTYRAEKENNPDLTPPKPIYQWLYRPEFQFSVYDLEIQALNRHLGDPENLVVQNIIDEETPIISSSDELIELAYSLLEDEEDMLTAFSFPEERELVFALGEEEVIANIGADQSVSFENLEHLASLDPEDFLSIRLYTNNDAANILWEYAFGKFTLITPSGDPVTAPVDVGDGQNEFTFDKSIPGVLVVNFKARAFVGDQSLQDIARHVNFEIDNIGSAPVWSQNNPGGRASVSNGFLVASATFTGLPASNNDFGNKQVLLKVNGGVVDSTTIEVFFDKFAMNNPSVINGLPNWFYYWREGNVCGIPATAIFDGSADFGYVRPGVDSFLRLGPYAALQNTGPETYTSKLDSNQLVVTGQGRGIFSVAETVEHELHHLTIYNTFLGADDADGDGIGDSGEAGYDNITTSVTDADTYNMASFSPGYFRYGDNEIRARLRELSLNIQVYPDRDWANPGSQSATKYGP